MESGAPLFASFVALGVSSLNYAVVAGETPGTARVTTLQTLSGPGFSVAGLMLLYSVLVLVRGLETDVPRSRLISQAMGNLVRVVIVFMVSPLFALLMWGGLRDHIGYRHDAEPPGFHSAGLGCRAVSLAGALCAVAFSMTMFDKPQHHQCQGDDAVRVSAPLP